MTVTSLSGRVALHNAFLQSPCWSIRLSPTVELSGDVGSYILKPERSVGIFDRDGLRNSPKLQFETWREVVFCLCRFSQLRRTLMGLPLVSCRTFLGLDIDSSRFSHIPHGR